MALTNFAALTNEQKTTWSRTLWKMVRENSFIMQFAGKGPNHIIQRVNELTKSEKGDRAVFTLLTDLEEDGVPGDDTLEGREEAMQSQELVITIDQLRHAVRNKGRMADQRSIIGFRGNAKDQLAFWMADRLDQLAFLTMSGVDYSKRNNLADRATSTFQDLAWAADVKAPSANRFLRWNGATQQLVPGDTTTMAPTDRPSYQMFVELNAFLKDNYMRGVRGNGGKEKYHCFISPQALARLKLDDDYITNVRNVGVRGKSNELIAGGGATEIDGIIIHDYRHVVNTSGLAAGSKWGAAGDVECCRMLVCGAQSMALADLGAPGWDEKKFDYNNQKGISTNKILGMLKPQFKEHYKVSGNSGQPEDFGILTVDLSQMAG